MAPCPTRHLAALGVALVCAAPALAGNAQVDFAPVGRYADAGPPGEVPAVQQALAGHLAALAERLPGGQTLHITITDIDLAGEIAWHHPRLNNVRVMGRLPDWPRIDLAWRLQVGERVLSSGRERVSDMNYLNRLAPARQGDHLPHEQQMLARWFDQRFGAAAAP